MRRWARIARLLLAAVAGALAACGAPPPAPAPAPAPPPAPIVETPPEVMTPAPPAPRAVGPVAKLAPVDPALEAWKRSAAERIHAANKAQLFEGKPHHLLRAVIVLEVTVDAGGRVVGSRILRSPKSKPLDDMALASLRKAAPLPPPPKALLRRGNLVYSETWLVQNDGRFQLRTLALPQD